MLLFIIIIIAPKFVPAELTASRLSFHILFLLFVIKRKVMKQLVFCLPLYIQSHTPSLKFPPEVCESILVTLWVLSLKSTEPRGKSGSNKIIMNYIQIFVSHSNTMCAYESLSCDIRLDAPFMTSTMGLQRSQVYSGNIKLLSLLNLFLDPCYFA